MGTETGVILQPGGLSGRPLLFGEVLYDQFQDGTAVVGGAPLNVTWHLRSFGLDPLMISRAGNDDLGAALLDRMQGHGLDCAGIQRDVAHPTGRVRVSQVDDEPVFSILPEQAYDFIEPEELPAVTDEEFALLYHGSLVARAGSTVALEVLRESGLPIFVDINLRPPWWEREQVEHLLSGARWLKLNHDELARLTDIGSRETEALLRGAATLCNRFGVQTVIVTRGAVGAVAVTADGTVVAKAPPVAAFADSVGSGDAFSAVILLGILRGWSLQTTLRRAMEFAAAICEVRGAIPADAVFYQRFLESWQNKNP